MTENNEVSLKELVKEKFSKMAGFTFLEILVTIIIMGVALIPIMRMMPEAMKTTTRLGRLTTAGLLAQSKIDEIRSQILGANPSYGFSRDYTQSSTAFPSPDEDFKFTVTDDQGLDIKELNVAVWFDEDGDDVLDTGEQSFSLDTKIANRG